MFVDYHVLIHKKLSGQANPEELQQLDKWLAEDPQHLKYFEDYCWIWSSMVDRPLPRAINLTSKLNEFRAITPSKTIVQAGEFRLRMKPNIIRRLGVAATVFTFVCVSALLISRKNQVHFDNPSSVAVLVDLPDGSQVQLDKNASIDYNGGLLNTKRSVHLKGQAYFTVSKNPQKPFTVNTPNGEIKVLGTQFNVSANSKNLQIHVSEGHVLYSLRTIKKDLYAGDEMELNLSTNEITLEHQKNENALSWFTGKLDFQNTPLDQVIKDLSKFYRKDIQLNNACLAQLKFTSTLDLSTQTELLPVLEILKATFNLNYSQITENSVQIDGSCK